MSGTKDDYGLDAKTFHFQDDRCIALPIRTFNALIDVSKYLKEINQTLKQLVNTYPADMTQNKGKSDPQP